jgi:hypothetical protein
MGDKIRGIVKNSCICYVLYSSMLSDNPDRNMKNEKCCSQLSTNFERYMACR